MSEMAKFYRVKVRYWVSSWVRFWGDRLRLTVVIASPKKTLANARR